MLRRFINRMHHDQKGITGLETAIILIAFVVVAAVFAFTALSAGLFSTEKSKEAVYSGLKEAQSTLELKGSVVSNSVQAIDTMDTAVGWTASSVNTTLSTEAVIVKEGTGSVQVDVVALSSGDYLYAALPAQDFTTTDTISFWVYSSDALAAADCTFAVDGDSDLSDAVPTFDLPIVSATTWTYVTGTLDASLADATYFGFIYNDNTIRSIYVDIVQGPVPPSNRSDMPTTYVDSVEFTVVNSLGGESIDCTQPTDTNLDGVLTTSLEKTNYLTVSYSDAYQQINDVAWTVTRIIGIDDYLLENNEIFKFTVDLKAVNLGATGDEKIGNNHAFTLEVKPATGAVLMITKTTPYVLSTVDDLN